MNSRSAAGSDNSMNSNGALSSSDRTFVMNAAQANLAEIDTAKMVEQKTSNPAVKDFAQRMVTDHSQAEQQLSNWAETAGVKLPTQASASERAQQAQLDKLSGKQLDDTYVRDELQDHKKVIAEFNTEIEHGQDHAVKSYAEQTLPVLQDHIRIDEDLAGKMDMSGKSGLNDENKAISAQ
jgi:putative membrane protein